MITFLMIMEIVITTRLAMVIIKETVLRIIRTITVVKMMKYNVLFQFPSASKHCVIDSQLRTSCRYIDLVEMKSTVPVGGRRQFLNGGLLDEATERLY